MIAYKYVTAARMDVLENGNIRFTQPAALNDPFEAMPCFVEYKQSLLPVFLTVLPVPFECLTAQMRQQTLTALDETIADFPKHFNDHFAFLSLTKQRNNLLMWSHYTDSHKGFVLGMDSDSQFFRPGNGKAVDGLREVVYSKKRWIVPRKGLVGLPDNQMRAENIKGLFTKSPEWSYEEELRIVAFPDHADLAIPDLNGGPYPVLLYKFPPDCIREIILGYRMEKAKREKIVEITRRKYPQADIFEAVLSETEFGVDIVPYMI